VRLDAREHLIEQRPARVHVGACVGALVDDDLGREVGDGADERAARGGGRGADGAGQAEVGDLDLAVGRDEHVLGLHVAVDQVRAVRRGQRRQDVGEETQRPQRTHGRLLAHHVAQGAPRYVLHDEVGDVAVAALVEDGHDTAVVELGGGARLPLEALRELLVVAEPGVHDLDGDRTVEPFVVPEEDAGHAAPRDPLRHPVPAVEDTSDERIITRDRHAGPPHVGSTGRLTLGRV
jgi:hypothetical protein